jgi:hypothetical protein
VSSASDTDAAIEARSTVLRGRARTSSIDRLHARRGIALGLRRLSVGFVKRLVAMGIHAMEYRAPDAEATTHLLAVARSSEAVRARHQSIAFMPAIRLIKYKACLFALPSPSSTNGPQAHFTRGATPHQDNKPTAERTMLDGGLRGRWVEQGQMMMVDWWAWEP